ncbi:MAG: ABC transporter ATP-binding protein [Candidatus Roseilinea sp.]|nr:MAG: ABC transporter ATP-binding protein [Candidatus Roseilinea sp.]
MSIVELHRVAKHYGRRRVLHDVTLAVQPGEFMVIYGMPASGKSVLVRLITGLEKPDSGRIIIRGQDMTRAAPGERNLGYVPQSFALYPHFSVYDNIAYPLVLAKVSKEETRAEVERAARLLKIEQFLDRRPDQLSGGQKQRVAIARGLVKQTEIFVLDDPLVGLDFKLRERLIEDLKATQEMLKATFIYTTSEAVEAMQLASTLAVLDRGEVIEVGPPEDLYNRPKRAETMRFVGFPQANFILGSLVQRDGQHWLSTSLFESPLHQSSHAQVALEQAIGLPISVGVRPEHIVIDSNPPDGALTFKAKVLLREDLGGEEIVYLDTGGQQLTTVLRSDNEIALHINIDEMVTAYIRPEHVVVYAGGKYVGRAG